MVQSLKNRLVTLETTVAVAAVSAAVGLALGMAVSFAVLKPEPYEPDGDPVITEGTLLTPIIEDSSDAH